eukprot:gene23591-biopygen17834
MDAQATLREPVANTCVPLFELYSIPLSTSIPLNRKRKALQKWSCDMNAQCIRRMPTEVPYLRISSGTCSDRGGVDILTASACEAAASALGLSDTDASAYTSSPRPFGCTVQPSASWRLNFYSNTANTGLPAGEYQLQNLDGSQSQRLIEVLCARPTASPASLVTLCSSQMCNSFTSVPACVTTLLFVAPMSRIACYGCSADCSPLGCTRWKVGAVRLFCTLLRHDSRFPRPYDRNMHKQIG